MNKILDKIPVPLMQWYQEHKRTLPWRSDPTAYHVWLSEIMLQQTRVVAVLPYYAAFLEAYPTISDLANAPLDEVLKLWQGLGYYSRARNLHKAAGVVRDDYGGKFPADYAAVRALPGVGDFTAAAICSISAGLPYPVVDGNVLRVVTRLTTDDGDILQSTTKKRITALLEEIIPTNDPASFNQAMMELGALVCLPNGAPKCEECPLAFCCQANMTDSIARYPVKTARKPRQIEHRTVYFIRWGDSLALRRRPDKGLLAELYEFPNELGAPSWRIPGVSTPESITAKHIFTHLEWHMTAVVVQAESSTLPDGWLWANQSELEDIYAIPNAFRGFNPLIQQLIGRATTWQNFISDME